MALFSKKTNTEEKAPTKVAKKPRATKTAKKAEVATPAVASVASQGDANHSDFSGVLQRPRITEKASIKAEEQNVYVFEVAPTANKETIFKAISDIYKVVPVKIAIAQIPPKNVFSRGKRGVKKGGKKAYVYLKKGEKIELI